LSDSPCKPLHLKNFAINLNLDRFKQALLGINL